MSNILSRQNTTNLLWSRACCHATLNLYPPIGHFLTIHCTVSYIMKYSKQLDLKKRLYLGPTSLDPSLAIIMANMAGVKRGHLAFDPFAGTASILVALAHFGMHCYLVV
jgi:tRNA G10  N-methylase Trm11